MKAESNTMDKALSIAIVSALVNIVFSTFFPCIMKKTKSRTLAREIKITYLVHREVLVASSVATAIMVYFAVKFEPEFRTKTVPSILNFFK